MKPSGHALIDQLGSFRDIFESREPIESLELNHQLQIIRKVYHGGQWQAEVAKIGKILEKHKFRGG